MEVKVVKRMISEGLKQAFIQLTDHTSCVLGPPWLRQSAT